jgi:opacity protein-like surface antigen
MKFGLGIYGNYKLSKLFSLKTNFLFGRLKGDESKYSKPAYRQERNFKFTSPVTEIYESVVWNIVPTAKDGGPRLTPYISAGVGYTFLRIRRDYSNFNAAFFEDEPAVTDGLRTDTAHSLPGGLLVFPVSAGLRYALTNNLSINLSTTYRLNSSDYLDGFSQSVNPAKKDHFFTNAIGLIYSFGKPGSIKCPKMKY